MIVVGSALVIGIGLWLLFRHTRYGKIVRAGVDDRDMVSALGINVQLVFAGAFFIGALLAGYGGVLGGTMLSLQPGEDTSFLLNSLIVVIIGGMGSLGGAAIGALALGLVDAYADVYLVFGDHDLTNYSILLTFALLVVVLAVRPLGPVREARMSLAPDAATVEAEAQTAHHATLSRTGWLGLAGVVAVFAILPLFVSDFWVTQILTKSLWLGLAASSLIFLSAYGGMVSLGQVAVYGIAGLTYANLVAADGGNPAAWSPWAAVVGAIVVTVLVGLAFGFIASRSEGIYFLMLTLAFSVLVYYFSSQVTQLSGFGGRQQRRPARASSATRAPIPRGCTSSR